MIDHLVANLQKDKQNDAIKKDWCTSEFDSTEDSIKDVTRNLGDATAAVEREQDSIEQLAAEHKKAEQELQDLEEMTLVATKQRETEHAQFSEETTHKKAEQELQDLEEM